MVPWATVASAGVKVIAVSVAPVTNRLVLVSMSCQAPLIVLELPVSRVVANPALSMVATSVSEDSQVTSVVISWTGVV